MRLVRVTRRGMGKGAWCTSTSKYRITPNWIYRGDFGGKRQRSELKPCSIYTGQWEDDLERHVCYTRTGDIVEDAKRMQSGPATIVYTDGSRGLARLDVAVKWHHRCSMKLVYRRSHGQGTLHLLTDLNSKVSCIMAR